MIYLPRQISSLAPAMVAAAVLAHGCAEVPEPAPICNMEAIHKQRQLVAVPGMASPTPSPLIEAPLNSVNITDFAILQKVWIRDVAVRRTPTGTVEIVSRVVNCTDFPLQIEARTQFFDAQRIPAEPVSAWRRLYLSPRSYETYQEKSTQTATVAHYLVEVREGR